MHTKAFFLVRILTALPFILLLVSCGQNTHIVPPAVSVTPSMPKETGTYPRKEIVFRVGDLQIRSTNGILCENHEAWFLPSDGGNLILATDRLKYDSAELHQMEAYAQAVYDDTDSAASLPNTLTWASGANELRFPTSGVIGCFGTLLLTNVGKDTIQLASINIRLTSASQKNERRGYHLIDICSLLPQSDTCVGGRGGPGQFYFYYRLDPAQNGKMFSPHPPTAAIASLMYQMGTNATLASNESAQVDLLFDSSQSDLTYSIVPQLVMSTSNEQHTFNLPQLATTLYFANQSLFSCYTLLGDTFVPEQGSVPRQGQLPGQTACV